MSTSQGTIVSDTKCPSSSTWEISCDLPERKGKSRKGGRRGKRKGGREEWRESESDEDSREIITKGKRQRGESRAGKKK